MLGKWGMGWTDLGSTGQHHHPQGAAAGALARFHVVVKSETRSQGRLGGNSRKKLPLAAAGGSHKGRVAGYRPPFRFFQLWQRPARMGRAGHA